MSDDLEPIASVATIELPGQVRPDSWREFEFDESGTTLVVRYWVDTRTLPWLADHSVDVALVLEIVLVMLLVWLTRRELRRPRTVGRTHCRRCGYDLTPPAGASVSPVCPECGRHTQGRVVEGRALRPWHFGPPTICLGIAIFFAPMCYSGLSSTQTAAAPTTWPIASIETNLPWWPLWRSAGRPLWKYESAVYSLSADGQLQGSSWDVSLGTESRISGDGSQIVALEFTQESEWTHRALIHDCDARTSRTIDFGTNADGFFQLASLAKDGRSALIIQTTLTGTAGESETRLLQLDLATGVLTQVASTSVPSADGRGGSSGYSTPDMSACVDGSAAISWALVAHDMQLAGSDTATTRRGSLLIVGTADGERRLELPRGRGKLWERGTCEIVDDFTVVINDSVIVDIRTGACTSKPYASFNFLQTEDPNIIRLVENEVRVIPTYEKTGSTSIRERGTLAKLDLRPLSSATATAVPPGSAGRAFSPRSGLCAVECAHASSDASWTFKVWRVNPKRSDGK